MSDRIVTIHKSPFPDMGAPWDNFDEPQPDVTGKILYRSGRNSDIYVTSELKAEIDEANSHGGLRESLAFHATNSLALSGLAKYRAICSAQYLIQQGELIKTGEILTETGSYYRNTGGLEYVYLSRDAISTSYCFTDGSSPDQYPIIFGIGGEEASNLIKRSWQISGHEIAVPGNIGLDSVKSVIVLAEDTPKIQGWVAEHCEEALVLSRDAAAAIRLGRYA